MTGGADDVLGSTGPGRRRIVVLGSTGSIGTQALDVVARNPDRFEVVGLTAGTNADTMAEQAAEFGVHETALGAADAERLIRTVEADVVLNGITGSVGLGPTLAALETDATLASDFSFFFDFSAATTPPATPPPTAAAARRPSPPAIPTT